MKKGGEHSGHSHTGPEPTHVKKRIGPAEHDNPGYHNVAYGHHRLNVGKHRLEYIRKPCKNRHCRSYGSSHPNCKCYGKMAKGGEVKHFCSVDNLHEGGCPYYKGGEVQKGLNLVHFKKIKEDAKSVTMGHPDGHKITIAKGALSALHRKQIEKLPVHLEAGGSPTLNQSSQQSSGTENDDERVDEDMPAGPPLPGDQAAPIANNVQAANNIDAEDQDPAELPAIEDQAPESAARAPATAQQAAPMAAPNAMDIYGKEQAAIQERSKAEQDLAQSQVGIEQQRQSQIAQEDQNAQNNRAAMAKDVDSALQDMKNGHIKPNQYLENMGTGQKVATAIGLLLGGFQGGLNRTGVNPAAEWLTGQINRDIEAQKAGLNNKENVYHAYLDKYKNAQVAEEMTRATHIANYASQIREAGFKAGTPLAIANSKLAGSEAEKAILPLINSAHLNEALDKFSNGVPSGGPAAAAAGAKGGNEAQYNAILNSSRTTNPALYADLQSKYVPGVGVATHSVDGGDREQFKNFNELLPLLDKAVHMQKELGIAGTGVSLGARLSSSPIANPAAAKSLMDELNVAFNKAVGLSRLNHDEFKNYAEQVGALGSMNLGGALETIKNARAFVQGQKNVAMSSAGIKPFSDAQTPTGLDPQRQQILDQFLSVPKNAKLFKDDPYGAILYLQEKKHI